MGFFKSGKTPAPQFIDYWTPGRLKESISQFGQVYRPEALDPIYKRAQEEMSQRISGEYASRGFGALRTGPAAYRASEAARQFGETRTADEQEQLMRFLQMRQSGAVSYTPQKTPSGFSALAGPLLGAVGYGMGGPIGGAIGSGFAGLFNRTPTQTQPQMPRDYQSGAAYN